MKIRKSLFRRAALVTLIAPVYAMSQVASVPVFGTGVDSSGKKLGSGALDPHWQLVVGPGVSSPRQAVVLNDQHPGGQYYETPGAVWIWGNDSGKGPVREQYIFEQKIDLTGFNPKFVSLKGFWGVDNDGKIMLNGKDAVGIGVLALTGTQLPNHNEAHFFKLTGGFVEGINLLQFQAIDAHNPGGLNVHSMMMVPEPSTYALLVVGVIFVTFVSLRRAGESDA